MIRGTVNRCCGVSFCEASRHTDTSIRARWLTAWRIPAIVGFISHGQRPRHNSTTKPRRESNWPGRMGPTIAGSFRITWNWQLSVQPLSTSCCLIQNGVQKKVVNMLENIAANQSHGINAVTETTVIDKRLFFVRFVSFFGDCHQSEKRASKSRTPRSSDALSSRFLSAPEPINVVSFPCGYIFRAHIIWSVPMLAELQTQSKDFSKLATLECAWR